MAEVDDATVDARTQELLANDETIKQQYRDGSLTIKMLRKAVAASLGVEGSAIRKAVKAKLLAIISEQVDAENLLKAEIRAGTLTSTTLRHCLGTGLDVNAPISRELLPIHLAALKDKPDCIRLLIAAGAEPNLRVKDSVSGDTALLLAARSGYSQSVVALLRAGADPNLASLRSGRTALHYMAAVGSVQGVAALLAAGADVDVVDTATGDACRSPCTPLGAAMWCGNPNALPTLLRAGARNCIGQFEFELQRELGRDDSDDELTIGGGIGYLRRARRVALLYLHRVAEAGGYVKYERMRRAAVMAMVVRSSKLPAALLIWVEHVADSFPDPLEEEGVFGPRVRLGL
jgi:hypothetical protein